MTATKMYGRGAIVLVDLEPVIGSEQSRTRPCIVLSDLASVRASGSRPLYFIVPLTTSGKLTGPLAPQLLAQPGGLPADSTALIMHARSVDPVRVVRQWGTLQVADLARLQMAIHELVES